MAGGRWLHAPLDVAAALRELIDRMHGIGIIVDVPEGVDAQVLYMWLLEQLGGHMGPVRDETELLYLPYDVTADG